MDPWFGLEEWLGRSAQPPVMLCAGLMHRTLALLQAPQKGQLGFGLFVSFP